MFPLHLGSSQNKAKCTVAAVLKHYAMTAAYTLQAVYRLGNQSKKSWPMVVASITSLVPLWSEIHDDDRCLGFAFHV